MKARCIALLTDFGVQDAYVGVVKGVMAGIAPEARVIDLTHAIPPGDVPRAAFSLWESAPYLPRGTVVLAVVDPGVGTDRRPLVIRWKERLGVGPDNGIFTYLLESDPEFSAFVLESPRHRLPQVSDTFQGRDLFAPAAAHLALGAAPESLGPEARDLTRIALPRLEVLEGGRWRGEVLHADRFGNCITSLGRLRTEGAGLLLDPWIPTCAPARLPRGNLIASLSDGRPLPLRRTFGEVDPGQPLAYIGSSGLLELAVRGGRAEDALALSPGDLIEIRISGRTPA